MKRYEIYKENPLTKIGERNNFGKALDLAVENGYCLVHDTKTDKWHKPIETI